MTALSVAVVAAAALGNVAPPAQVWIVPSLLVAAGAGYFGLRRGHLGWWWGCGALVGLAACAAAPRLVVDGGDRRVPVRFVGSVRDGWSRGAFAFTNRLRIREIEVRGGRGPRWRELRIEIASGQATLADLPPPGRMIAGSGELALRPSVPLARPTLKVESLLLLSVKEGGSTVDLLRERGVAATLGAAGTNVDRIRAAGLACALFFGRQELLREGEVEALRHSGLAHLLAVSGLNVGLVAVVVVSVLLLFGVTPRIRRLAVAAACLAFCVVSGGFAPVRRAAFAAAGYLLARSAGRPLEPLPVVWGIVAGLVVLEPDAVMSPGFQLSAGVTLALVRWVGPLAAALPLVPRPVADAVSVAVVAQAAAAPLIGAHFSFVPPLALAANLAAAPLTLAMTALSMAAATTAPVHSGAAGVALGGVALCQRVLDAVAGAAAGPSVPFPPPGTLMVIVFCVVAAVALGRGRRSGPAAAALVTAVLVWPALPAWPNGQRAEVRMLPVGDGMSLLVHTAGGAMVVDGGRSATEAARALSALRVRDVESVIVTHADADHIGGVGRILLWHRPRTLIVPEPAATRPEVVTLRRLARRLGVTETLVSAGERVDAGAVRIDVFWPRVDFVGDDNDASLVFAARPAGVRVLVTGDIEAVGERDLLAARVPLRAAVLQLPHHGSRTSSTREFLAAVDPVVALGAAGERPRYRYPHAETLRRLRERRIVVLPQPAGFGALWLAEGVLTVDTRTPVRVADARGRR